jgi:hypothetical protein
MSSSDLCSSQIDKVALKSDGEKFLGKVGCRDNDAVMSAFEGEG